MALRNVVKIDEKKCNGCGQCVSACAEGAIQLVNGKAKLISETYCDGLGACIGRCPQDAITVEKREANPFDKEATKVHLADMKQPEFVCPGLSFNPQLNRQSAFGNRKSFNQQSEISNPQSQLTQWPVQIKLVPTNAPYFADSHLLLVADCVPFAVGDFHNRFLRGKSIVIGCPKLDDARFYIEKLADIFRCNKLKELSVIHMEVPCCHGLTRIATEAMAKAGQKMPFEDVTVSLQGSIEKTELVKPK
jgi:Pyruvate/2-oxoacid:ferredoxin oxidoreductase delta subunit